MLREQVDLQPYNTLALHARAACFCEPANLDELLAALSMASQKNMAVLPLGEGSNIVLTRDYPGMVLRLLDARIKIEHQDASSVHVRVGAGMRWHSWVEKSLESGWYGLENLALIPGTVGAAPVQNIGAYGVEISRFILSVRGVFIDTGEEFNLDNNACQFAYRNSVFKRDLAHKTVITSVLFCLSTQPIVHAEYAALHEYLIEHHAQEVAAGLVSPSMVKEAVCAVRRSRLPDPYVLPNVGSFFKNPQVSQDIFSSLQERSPSMPFYAGENGLVKLAAAWLIDQAGWKGRCLGAACVHDKQALVLVNRHGATGDEVIALAQAIIMDVKEKFGVTLEYEPLIL
jgi:UDP-N-acetylmuramate dehydrogenase